MTTLLETTASRIRMRDTDGTVTFDTSERLFVLTDAVISSKTCSRWRARSINNVDTQSQDSAGFSAGVVNADINHTLATGLNTSADTVRGAFSVTTGSPGSQVVAGTLASLGSFNASGSYIHYHDACNRSLSFNPWDRNVIRACAVYTFFVTGGTLYLNERVWLQAEASTSGAVTYIWELLAPTFNYHIAVGCWV